MSGVVETFILNKIPEDSVVMLRIYQNDVESRLKSVICDDGISYEFTDTKDKIIAHRLKDELFFTLLKRLGAYNRYITLKETKDKR